MATFYKFEDLSGSTVSNTSDNPFQDLIAACHDDAAQIQARYDAHRTNRHAQQKAKFVDTEFNGVMTDEILAKLNNPMLEPGFQDWRHCLTLWARPPLSVRNLISRIQERLLKVVPGLWIMPGPNLHMTAIELAHSLTADEIEAKVKVLAPHAERITNYTYKQRARLVKPMLCFDAQALALSFLPATTNVEDGYTYHHLRRDLFDLISASGVKTGSRYVVPSAHLTIGRFIHKTDLCDEHGVVDREKIMAFIDTVDEINSWLSQEFWPKDKEIEVGCQWIIGEEKGLECRRGTLWYGEGGETVCLGKGF